MEEKEEFRIQRGKAPDSEKHRRQALLNAFKESSIAPDERLSNLGVFHNRRSLSRLFFLHQLYQRIIPVPGVVIEFGVRWGQTLSLFSNFRGMYEPYNYNRRIVGFDTFSGFSEVLPQDGKLLTPGDYSVSANYEKELSHILELHEADYPYGYKRKFELVKGDATKTFPEYLKKNPHTVIALAYFDFDLYGPTKACLPLVMERVTKGSVIVFDELNSQEFPGETIAVMETIGLSRYSLKRDPFNPLCAYFVVGEN